jgi:hypothetical protein
VKLDESFDPYKSHIVRTAPQPRGGKSSTEKEVDRLKRKQEEILATSKVDRHLQVVLSGSVPAVEYSSAIPAKSSSDTQLVLQAMRARKQEQEKATQFRTKGSFNIIFL